MRKFFLFGVTITLFGMLTNGSVWAHNRYNFGFNLGYYSPGYYGHFGYRTYGYPYPYFYPPAYIYPPYYPPTIIAPTTPPVYIQKEESKSAQPQTHYWYYCRDPEGYYPYIKQCPGGWQQIAPQPSDQ